ncbi:IclR family transcriptional regulator [Methylobacterium sp. NFXW15]|uniref:IclR family transcriptional regulator n=1 Tax=Methylobacterium sp. NFXW15 TaxID=2819512 RepID=UPI003CEDD8BC
MDEAAESSPALKAFGLLEAIAAMDHAPTLAELTEVANLPKPTLHRWLTMLEGAELLRRLPDGRRYELAARSTSLAFAILSNNPGSIRRHQILQGVVRDLGESCNLTVLQGGEVMYLDRVEAAAPLRVAFQKGSRVPAHCSASGKLFLALMPRSRRERLLATLPLDRFTANTLTEPGALEAELQQIKRQGYALDDEEFLTGLFCVAVPILDRDGRDCVAALALQAPVVRLWRENAPERLPVLRAAASALAATLT